MGKCVYNLSRYCLKFPSLGIVQFYFLQQGMRVHVFFFIEHIFKYLEFCLLFFFYELYHLLILL